MMIKNCETWFCLMAATLVFLLPVAGVAQDNGQNLRFQGISEVPDFMVKSSAMGGAYTAVTGDLPSLYYNPAGLADLKKIQISVSGNSFKKEMWEDNFWWGGGYDVILVRLWDGSMPLPPRELAGKKAYEIWPNETLPDFHVPVGTDYFDKARADWVHQADDLGLNSLAAAVPITLGKRHIVLSGGFSRNWVEDYDYNPTRLIPHPGRLPDPYWVSPDPNKTTLWTRYERARTGPMNRLSAAVAVGVIPQIKLGLGYHQMWSKTDDALSVKEVMQCNLTNADHDWTYAYKDGKFDQAGTSEFKLSQLDLGAVFQFGRFNFGFRARINSAITRNWEYTNTTTDQAGQKSTAAIKGTDKIEKIPPTLSFGLGFTPKDYAKFSFDIEKTAYSKASHVYDAAYVGPDGSATYAWVDQTILRAGMEIKVHSKVSLLAGYQFAPKNWAPFRAAFDWEGQPTHIYSFGASIGVPFGNLDVAYQITRFKYYDAFMYGVPNNSVRTTKMLFGYTFIL
jgi:hypothetical protein